LVEFRASQERKQNCRLEEGGGLREKENAIKGRIVGENSLIMI